MNVTDLMRYYDCKTQQQLCEKLNISRVTVWKWLKNGIPTRTQSFFQVKTKGKLKAEFENEKTASVN